MSVRPRHAILAVLAALAPVWPASAQQITSPYRFVEETQTLGAFGGWILTNPGDLDLGPQSGPAVGGRYALRLGGPFLLEAGAAYLPTSRRVQSPGLPGAPPAQIGEADLNLVLLNGGFRFNLTGPRTYRGVMPYLTVGGGLAMQLGSSEIPEEEDLSPDARYRFGTTFSPQFGGGVDWFVTSRLAVRADARNVMWPVRTPAMFIERDPSLPNREWAQNLSLSLGVFFHF